MLRVVSKMDGADMHVELPVEEKKKLTIKGCNPYGCPPKCKGAKHKRQAEIAKALYGTPVSITANKKRKLRVKGTLSTTPRLSGSIAKIDDGNVVKTADYQEVVKVDSDKREVYGWAQVAKINGEPVADRQGDITTIEEIEKAAHDFVKNSRTGGVMHKRTEDGKPVHVADVIESMVYTEDKIKALGMPEDTPEGWWIGVKVHDDDTWEKVKDGTLGMFSVHGRGRREAIEDE